jgi:hypothetical protein
MTKDERDALVAIRNELILAKAQMPLSAEYKKGVANHGAGGAIAKAIDALSILIGDDDGETEPVPAI